MATASNDSARTSNSWPIVGRATLTIVMSMMFMNIAATKTTLTAIFGFRGIRGTCQHNGERPPGVPPGGRSACRKCSVRERAHQVVDAGGELGQITCRLLSYAGTLGGRPGGRGDAGDVRRHLPGSGGNLPNVAADLGSGG